MRIINLSSMKKSELNSWRLIKDQKLNDVAGKCALRIYRN